MPRKTKREVLASFEREYWKKSINCITDTDKRIYLKTGNEYW